MSKNINMSKVVNDVVQEQSKSCVKKVLWFTAATVAVCVAGYVASQFIDIGDVVDVTTDQ